MAEVSVASLVREGRLEKVAADVTVAWSLVDEANTHLGSSVALGGPDPALAYIALYDAARKAITAHMQAHGYRLANRAGAHQAAGLYAEATLAAGAATSDIRAFDRMRQIRNRSEYGRQLTKRLLATDLGHARAIVAAIEAALPPRPATQ